MISGRESITDRRINTEKKETKKEKKMVASQ